MNRVLTVEEIKAIEGPYVTGDRLGQFVLNVSCRLYKKGYALVELVKEKGKGRVHFAVNPNFAPRPRPRLSSDESHALEILEGLADKSRRNRG